MLKRGMGHNSGLLFQLTHYLLLLFFSLVGLPILAGADTGGLSSFNQAADNRIRFNNQDNLGSVADDKYWKDIFKTNELTGQVKALFKDSAGNLYVGGNFSTAGGVTVNHIAKWDGTKWSALGSGVFSPYYWNGINALAMDGAGNLFAGGQFYTAGGVAVNNIAKWDGTKWSALGTGIINGSVSALAVDGAGNLYAGGQFNTAGGVAVNNIAKWDGTKWSALGTGLSGSVMGQFPQGPNVNALAVEGTNLYVGGIFTTAGGNPASNIAVWDGTSSWSALGTGLSKGPGPGPGPSVNALAVDGGKLYAGGTFDTAGGIPAKSIAVWDGTSSWSALGTGLVQGMDPGTVNALAVDGPGKLYAGGLFTTAGGIPALNIARWDGTASQWTSLETWIGPVVYALAVTGSEKLYVGGGFTTSSFMTHIFQANYLAMWNGTTSKWSAVTEGANGGLNGSVTALAKDTKGSIYAGGQFGTAGGTLTNYIAKWDGTTWSALGNLGNGVNSNVYALAVDGTNLYVGGWFSGADYAPGVPPNPPTSVGVNGIAKWDGTTWSALGAAPNAGVGGGGVYALAVDGTSLYVGGYFTTAGGVTVNNIAKWNGTTWSALGTGANVGVIGSGGYAAVNALAVDGTNLYVGGYFTTAGGVAVSNIAKWDGTTWSALGSGINGGVSALAVDGAGNLYVGGSFTFYDADTVKVNNIAKWDGTKWSALGSGVDAGISALAADGAGNLYVGGSFYYAGGVSANGLALWDGTKWSAFGSGVDATVSALTVVGPGDLFAGGSFALAGGKSSAFIGQWTKVFLNLPLILK